MSNVIWLKRARTDLDRIVAYIKVFNPAAADRIAEQLEALASILSNLSERGRLAGRNTREMVTVRPYILRYRVTGEEVVIVSVRHQRRRKPLRP